MKQQQVRRWKCGCGRYDQQQATRELENNWKRVLKGVGFENEVEVEKEENSPSWKQLCRNIRTHAQTPSTQFAFPDPDRSITAKLAFSVTSAINDTLLVGPGFMECKLSMSFPTVFVPKSNSSKYTAVATGQKFGLLPHPALRDCLQTVVLLATYR